MEFAVVLTFPEATGWRELYYEDRWAVFGCLQLSPGYNLKLQKWISSH